MKEWKLVIFWSAVILALALFLRTYNLLSVPIFADEAIYVRWAQVMRAEPTLRFLPLSDGKQPLFMWVVMGILQFFSDPLIAGRLVSVFAGLGTLIGIFLLTLRLFNSQRAALVAALFYAVSPFSVFFDRMALVDSMLTMFGIWSLYFGVLTAQTLRLDTAMLTGFALGGAWLTKSPAVFFLLLLPATALVAKKLQPVKLVGLWFVSWFIAGVMYNILRLGPNFHLIASRNQDYIFTFQEVLKHPFDPLQFHIREILEWFWVLLPGTILLASIAGLFFGWKKNWRVFLLLGVWVLFPLLVQAEFAKVFTARYILFTIPPLFVLAAAPAAVGMAASRGLRLWAVLGVLLLPALWIDYLFLTNPQKAPLPRVERSGYLEEWTAGTGIREIAQFIKEEAARLRQDSGEAKGIVAGTEGFFGTLPDGLQIYVSDIPDVTVIGVGVSISDVHPSLIEAKKFGNKVYLVVNSTRFHGDPEREGLKLLSSYPKAQRPGGIRESLLLFEVTNEAIAISNAKRDKKD